MRYGELRPRIAGCALRKRVLEKHGWNFYGNEYTLLPVEDVQQNGTVKRDDGGLCQEMAYLMVFRWAWGAGELGAQCAVRLSVSGLWACKSRLPVVQAQQEGAGRRRDGTVRL